ncbi:MAG: ABC transporter permease [Alphaproteobacteria bacterium]|nr:ABC transporter permease [Alphaproteobacteria bacterium]
MMRFLVHRIVQAFVVLLAMSFVIYGLIGLMPGDPIDLMISADPNLTPADAERLKAIYGLDRPFSQRYLAWLVNALGGDFGYSRLHAKPVMDVLLPRLGNTLVLMGVAFAVTLAIALPIGTIAAIRRDSAADYAINFVAFAGISTPPFWLALLLIMLFSVTLGWLPAGGMGNAAMGGGFDRLTYLVLPVMTLSLASIGGYTRYTRAAMGEALGQDYIRTAWAKGANMARVVIHHALPNALIPIVTIIALDFGTLFSGALITETMFSYLGMGKLIYDSIMGNDFNLALVGLLLATFVVLMANLFADIAYTVLDPRINFRAQEAAP